MLESPSSRTNTSNTKRTDSGVFVGGIKGNHNEENLLAYFEMFGPVSKVSMKMKPSNNGRDKEINCGFAVVGFYSKEIAQKVIDLQTHHIGGRLVTCRQVLSGEDLILSKRSKDDRKIFISNLSPKTVNSDLISLFSKFGELESAYTISDQKNGKSQGYGFAIFKQKESLQNAILKCKGKKLHGRKINVSKYVDKTEKAQNDQQEIQIKLEEEKPKKDKLQISLQATDLLNSVVIASALDLEKNKNQIHAQGAKKLFNLEKPTSRKYWKIKEKDIANKQSTWSQQLRQNLSWVTIIRQQMRRASIPNPHYNFV